MRSLSAKPEMHGRLFQPPKGPPVALSPIGMVVEVILVIAFVWFAVYCYRLIRAK
jgi:hypothetical protein